MEKEKLLVTQALDERDLLKEKISDLIRSVSFTEIIKPNEEKVAVSQEKKEDFVKKAEANYQKINDLIKRYSKIEAAIVASNSQTVIKTSFGDFTVAGAIAERARLRNPDDDCFEKKLAQKMSVEYASRLATMESKNRSVEASAEGMRTSILGKDAKVKDDKPLAVVDAYVKENTYSLVDPLDVKEKIEAIGEKQRDLLKELETKIKVSNATTYIVI